MPMIRRICILMLALMLVSTVAAQDGLDLPTELYVLTNSGQVQQYGLGTTGIHTVTPEDTFVIDFGVAPDGNWLTYRTETGLTLYNIYTQVSQEIEGASAGLPPFRGRGDTMTWSPDGDAVAYSVEYGARIYFSGDGTFQDLREGAFEQLIWSPGGDYLAGGAEQNIWWLYRREGNQLILTSAIPSSLGFAWVNATELAFAPAEGGLIRMNLAQANAQTLLLDDSWVYQQPAMLGDGRLGVFGRQKEDAEIPEGSGILIALTPDSAEVTTLGESPVDLNGTRWAPGGNLMIALRGGVLALVGPANGAGFALPVSDAVAYSWGAIPLERVGSLELPNDGYFLTKDENDITQVWRLPGDGSSPAQVTKAEAAVTVYALAPNGRSLVYASGGKLWTQALNSDSAELLTDVAGREVRSIAFSGDGTRIVFDTLSTPEDAVGGIWLVASNGGEAELLLQNGPSGATAQYAPPFYRAPQFAPNINALLVVSGQSEGQSFAIFDLSSKTVTDLGSYDEASWLSDGRVLAYGNGAGIGEPPPTQPIVIINPADLSRQEITALPAPRRILSLREIKPGTVRMVIGSWQAGPRAMVVLDLDVNNGALTPAANGGFMVETLLSPDGTWAAGLTHTDGMLTLRDLASGRQVLLAQPSVVDSFQWAI